MRIIVDRESDAVRLVMSRTGVADTRTLADGISAEFDMQGRLVAITIQEVAHLTGAPDALSEVTIGLSAQTGEPRSAPPSAPPAPLPLTLAERAKLGPLTWEPEAEAAMAAMPFFERGAQRRAVVDLARARGLSRVTAKMVEESGSQR